MEKELLKLIDRNSVSIEESEKNGIIAHHVEVDDLISELVKLFKGSLRFFLCKKFDPFPNGICRTCGTNHRKKAAEDIINNTTIIPPFGESFIACHPEDGSIEHFKTTKEAEEYIMEVEGNGADGFSEAAMGGECWIAKKVKVSHFKETSNSESDEYCQCGKNEDDEVECPSCKHERWPYEFDSIGRIEFHNVK